MTGLLDHGSSERPALIVHIGGAKAGSTAIQDFMFANRRTLSKAGIAVPNTEMVLGPGRCNQIWFFQNLIGKEGGAETLTKALDGVTAERPRAVVLSAENLSNDHDLASLFEPLKARFSLHVLLYIRRQEDAYQSAWQQWFSKTGMPMDDWLQSTPGPFCDWAGTAARWEAIGPDSMTLRVLDRQGLVGGDVVEDFCSVLGLDIAAFRRSEGAVNASFGVHVSDLYSAMHGAFENTHDLSVESRLYQLGIEAAAKVRGEWIFTRDQLAVIRDRHAAGNARLKARYFAERPGEELFPPVPAEDVTGPPREEINRRNIGVLGEVLFKERAAMSARIDDLLERQERMEAELAGLRKSLEIPAPKPESPEPGQGPAAPSLMDRLMGRTSRS